MELRCGRLTHASIPALGIGIVSDDAGIALLQVLLAWRLDDHGRLGAEPGLSAHAIGVGGLGGARSGWSGVHGVWLVLDEP